MIRPWLLRFVPGIERLLVKQLLKCWMIRSDRPLIPHTINDLINVHSQINASYPINVPLRRQLCFRLPPNKRPASNRRHPRIASKTKETLYRVKSYNLLSFFLAWLTMTNEFHLAQSPQLCGICAHCQSSPRGSEPDIDIELWTTSLSFALD